MKFAESLRNKAYWTLDSLKGSKIKNHYDDIKFILENYDSDEARNKVDGYLAKLLKHAATTTEFYEKYSDNLRIENFPVIDKKTIRENFDGFLSREYKDKPFIKMTTSGSTGTPFTVYQDMNKKARNLADTMYFAKFAGYSVGEKLAYLKIWSDSNKKSGKELWMQNLIALDVLNLGDEKIKSFLESVISEKPSFNMLGYSSAYDVICDYLDRKSAEAPVYKANSIISMSETLDDFTKERLNKYFDTRAVSRYSNLENGILAQQCREHNNEYHINAASYYVEVLKMDSDEISAPGEEGRIVVTDMFNMLLPIIRYDTGDIGVIADKAGCDFNTPVFEKIEGRKLDLIFNTKDERVSSYIVYKNMWKYTELLQYQLIQYDKGKYVMKINPEQKFDRHEEMTAEFLEYLGADADFKIEEVEEIPLLSSGKRKKIVNTMTNVPK